MQELAFTPQNQPDVETTRYLGFVGHKVGPQRLVLLAAQEESNDSKQKEHTMILGLYRSL